MSNQQKSTHSAPSNFSNTAAHTFQGKIGKTLGDSFPHWAEPVKPKTDAPNVIVILLDDLGYSDFGCFGGEIDTPNIDKLALNGLRFTGYTTVPMCTPARAAMLTGKNPHAVGCGWLTHNNPGFPGYKGGEMSSDAPTLAELLRMQGYATMAVGKWHNTYDRNSHAGGDRSSWPLQRGFDRFYGFLAAETSYFHPERMMEGNQLSQVDTYPEDYFATDDYTHRLIGWLKENHACAPEKPFFAWLAFQAPHTPLQAKPVDMARYKDRYKMGWDELRKSRFGRQRALQIIELNAAEAPRNPGVPAWDTLSQAQQGLFATYMACYAALVDNVDQNVGKLLAFLKQSGQLENTLILITSDNGANSIGGPEGVANLNDRRQGIPEDPATVMQLLKDDQIGSESSYAAYPTGWTQVSNTPYRYYKRTPMAGGIRVPLIAHWPKGIASQGEMRRQWVHVTDITPTILDLVGGYYPQEFNGFRTRGMDGISFAKAINNAEAPTLRTHQHYELEGNRGYILNGWKIVSLQPPGSEIDLDRWMLFDLANDPSEIHDLSKDKPEKVRELIVAFETDALANFVYPIDNRDTGRAITLPPYELATIHTSRHFYPGGQSIASVVVSPLIADRNFELSVIFDFSFGSEGVLYALGDRFTGILAFVENDHLHFVWQRWMRPIELAPIPIEPGRNEFVMAYHALEKRQGLADFSINGKLLKSQVALSPTPVRLPSGGLDVGINRRQAISPRIEGRGGFKYTHHIEVVKIVPGEQAVGSPMVMDEAKVQARMRAMHANKVDQ
jgi:arylsulfatase